jgi:DNA-binding response OmpR family regulator
MTTLLTVYDNPHYLPKLNEPLEQEGYAVAAVTQLEQIANRVREVEPMLVVFHVDLETHDSRRLCALIHSVGHIIPILFVVPLYFSAQQVASILDAGADDVLKRPFAPSELKARVRALLRRSKKRELDEIVRLQLDPRTHIVQVNQREVELTPVEFELLNFLCKTRPHFHTAPDLLQRLWDYPPQGGDTALVRNHIRNLRLKLESDPDRPRVLVSQYGRGYSVRALVRQS